MSAKPPELSFLNGLSQKQIIYALQVAREAEKAGVPPKLAVAIAYQESKLNPNSSNGADGEIGGMQILPSTAKSIGFSLDEIKTPEGNIKAGVKYLKMALEKSDQNPKLAAYGYNAGLDSSLFYGGEPNPKAKHYANQVGEYGAYDGLIENVPTTAAAESSAAAEGDNAGEDSSRSIVVKAEPAEAPPPDTSGASKAERFIGGSAGATTGAAAALGKGIFKAKDARAIRLAKETAAAAEKGRLAAQAAAGTTAAGSTGVTGSAATGSSQAGKTIPIGTKDAGRMTSGQTGNMPYNYAKSAGLTDIEAARALDMTKQEGGVHDLSTQRREGLNRVNKIAPNQFVENPAYGGIMTPDQGGGKGPRQSFKVQGALPTADLPPNYMPGPAAPPPQGTLVEIPRPTPPAPPAPPSLAQRTAAGLDEVANLFKSMMKPVAATAKYVGKYALPPIAGLSAGLDAAEMAHEYHKPEDQRDYIKMGTKGAGLVGGALSMFPPTAPVGVPLMLGAGAVDLYRDPEARAYVKKKMEEAQQGIMSNVGVPFEFGPAP
jgi:hypothetical protein